MIFKWFRNKKITEPIDFNKLKKEINKWDIEKAKKFVFDILQDDTKYNTIARQHNDGLNTAEMPTQLVESFYNSYENCTQIYGDIILTLNGVGESEYRKEYIRVAKNTDATEVVVKKDFEEIFEIDGSDFDFTEEPFSSLYHWLVFNSYIVYPPYNG